VIIEKAGGTPAITPRRTDMTQTTTPLGDALAKVDRAQAARLGDGNVTPELEALRELAEAVRAHLASHPERPREDAFAGYTQTELEAAFDLVKNPRNWKLPINATVPKDTDLRAVSAAVAHFTGGGCEMTEQDDGTVRVTGDGYYVHIGA
jgi:hypothetical protein